MNFLFSSFWQNALFGFSFKALCVASSSVLLYFSLWRHTLLFCWWKIAEKNLCPQIICNDSEGSRRNCHMEHMGLVILFALWRGESFLWETYCLRLLWQSCLCFGWLLFLFVANQVRTALQTGTYPDNHTIKSWNVTIVSLWLFFPHSVNFTLTSRTAHTHIWDVTMNVQSNVLCFCLCLSWIRRPLHRLDTAI